MSHFTKYAAVAILLTALAFGHKALGTITIDLVPKPNGSNGVSFTPGGNLVRLLSDDAVLNMDVFVRVRGANSITSDDEFHFIQGGFVTPGLLGDLSATLDPTFTTLSANPGIPRDHDGDGDLDIVGPNTGNVSGWWYPRAASMLNGGDFYIGTLTLRAKARLADANVAIQFLTRVTSGTGAWRVDGATKIGVSASSIYGDVLIGPKLRIGDLPLGGPAFVSGSTATEANVATGGAVVVSKVDGAYVSEVDALNADAEQGQVLIRGIEQSGPVYLLVELADTDPSDSITVAGVLQDMSAITAGPDFDALKLQYPFMQGMLLLPNFQAGDQAVDFSTGGGVFLNRVAAVPSSVVPEPAAGLGIAAMGLSLLRRRTVTR